MPDPVPPLEPQPSPVDTGPSTLAFHHDRGGRAELVPLSLLREAIKTVPDVHVTRLKLISWSNGELIGSEVPYVDVESVADELESFSHLNRTELGRVGRLPGDSAWRIVDLQEEFTVPIAASVVLACALRRQLLMRGHGSRVVIRKLQDVV